MSHNTNEVAASLAVAISKGEPVVVLSHYDSEPPFIRTHVADAVWSGARNGEPAYVKVTLEDGATYTLEVRNPAPERPTYRFANGHDGFDG